MMMGGDTEPPAAYLHDGGPEAHHQGGEADDAALEQGLRRVAIKILVSNAAAGSIIGKGGVAIGELQRISETHIQISQASEHFPGTSDRMALITGELSNTLMALHLIFARLKNEGLSTSGPLPEDDGTGEAPEHLELRVIVPSLCCGGIIGKGGSTIKHFIADSGAQISVSTIDQQPPGVHERTITVAGQLEQLMRAVALVMSKMADEPNYDPDASRMSYSAPQAFMMMPGPQGAPIDAHAMHHMHHMAALQAHQQQQQQQHQHPMAAVHHHHPQGPMHHRPQQLSPMVMGDPGGVVEKTIGLQDEHVGVVVGKAGRTLAEIQQSTGARISVSSRGEFLPGTTQRAIKITGFPQGIAMAESAIEAKIQAVFYSNNPSR